MIWADGGYNAWQVEAAVAKVPVLRTEIVKRSGDMSGFVILPRRRVVERTFSWLGRNRRLAKDFDNLAEIPGHLCYPRFHPACHQAARQGLGRELIRLPVLQRAMGVCKGRDKVVRSVIGNDPDGTGSGHPADLG